MKKLSIIIVCILIGSECLAVGLYMVSGKIIGTDQESVPFAVIRINDSTATTSDIDGNFKLTNLSKGVLKLSITSIGYQKKEILIDLDQILHVKINVRIEMSETFLKEVYIKGQSETTEIERSGFSVSSIDTKKIASKSIELNEVLDQVPGLKVRQSGGLGSSTSYNINGLSGNAVRIFVDGIPIESFGPSYSINSIPVSLIDRVDVYKGVVPIELANDALGGAINIITKKQAHNALNVSYSYGSFNTHQAAVSGLIRNDTTGITISGSGFYNYSDNDYEVSSNDVIITDDNRYLPDGTFNPSFGTIERGVTAKRFNDAYKSYGAKVGLGVTNKKWADQFLLALNMSQGYNEIQHGATMLQVYGERHTTNYTVAPSINYTKKGIFTDKLDVNASFQYSFSENALIDTTRNSYNWYGDIRPAVINPPPAGEGGVASLNIDHNNSYISKLFVSYSLNENNKLSVSYSINQFFRSSDDIMRSSLERAYGSSNSVNKQIGGLSYQNSAFESKLKSSVFAKYYSNALKQDRVDLTSTGLDTVSMNDTYHNWGAGFTMAYEISSQWQINASAENAVRLVSAYEVFGNVSRNIVASDGLKPESSDNFNLGVMYSPTNKGVNNLDISTNLFYRNTRDKIRRSPVVDADMDDIVYTNVGHVISMGIELGANYNIANKYDLSLQGYYLDSRFKEQLTPKGEVDLRYNSREPNVPYLTASMGVTRHFSNAFGGNGKLDFSWYGSYVHSFFLNWEVLGSQNKDVIPAQFINDFGISYAFTENNLRLSMDLKNAFNTMAFDNYAIQKPGRALYIKISYRF